MNKRKGTRFEAQIWNSSQMGLRPKMKNKHSSPDKIRRLQLPLFTYCWESGIGWRQKTHILSRTTENKFFFFFLLFDFPFFDFWFFLFPFSIFWIFPFSIFFGFFFTTSRGYLLNWAYDPQAAKNGCHLVSSGLTSNCQFFSFFVWVYL